MKADKNTIIGFALLGVLFFAFFWNNNRMQQALLAEQKHAADSIALVKASRITPEMKEKARLDSIRMDSISNITKAGTFPKAGIGKEEVTVVDNELMQVAFTNKGGRVKTVMLKKYKSFDSTQVLLGSGDDRLGYTVNTSGNSVAQSDELFFTAGTTVKNADGSQTIDFTLKDSSGRVITHHYVIRPNEYMIDWNIDMQGANGLLTNNTLNFNWIAETRQHERSAAYERQQSNICYTEGNEFDTYDKASKKDFEKPVQWLAVVQQFFNMTIVAKNSFNSGSIEWARNLGDTTSNISKADANFQIKTTGSNVSIPMQLYFGPNDYQILKKEAPEMDRIVNLGRGIYSFVRPLNKYILMPVFNFFATLISNYGWVILLLTLFIRLITAPLMYSSYLSGAKMRVLRPELDVLKKKFGDDKQAFAMEQMKFFREAGVNQLGGCIPALLQIPIFFALYSFFNSNIALRGQSFLWSHDLSSFDSIITWKTDIWGIGNHLSLFTVTAIATNLLISIYNMSMTPTQDNPAMKYMPYIFPFVLFFVFNKLPSALTWYYTVSNTITLLLQFTILNYVIDHNKIIAGIEAKRKAPKNAKPKTKWQERYEQMMESQKKLQDAKNKAKK